DAFPSVVWHLIFCESLFVAFGGLAFIGLEVMHHFFAAKMTIYLAAYLMLYFPVMGTAMSLSGDHTLLTRYIIGGVTGSALGLLLVPLYDWAETPATQESPIPPAAPVMAVDCHLALLPTVVPPSGLNYIDFKYSSGMIGVTGGGQPGSQTTWLSDRIVMPMYCEFTSHQNIELYDVFFNLHVTFHEVAKRPGGQIENGTLLGERAHPIAIGRINNNFSFGFYAFTTGEHMVYVTFPDKAKYLDGQNSDPKDVRLLTIHWKALSFPPASALAANK